MRYNRKNDDIEAHVRQAPIHPRVAGGAGIGTLPVGTENQTLRKNATAWEATSILKINATGPENTIDHADGTLPRMVNIVYVASPGALVAANTVPVGTLGIIYTP